MRFFNATIVDEYGNIQPNSWVEVRSELTGLLVLLFDIDDNPLANPFQVGADAFAQFRTAVNGYFSIQVTLPDATVQTWRQYPLFIYMNNEQDNVIDGSLTLNDNLIVVDDAVIGNDLTVGNDLNVGDDLVVTDNINAGDNITTANRFIGDGAFIYQTLAVIADYTITDILLYNTFLVNPTAGDVTITLPTLADNLNRTIKVKVSHLGGLVTIDGEGAETIDGETTVNLVNQYDYIEIIAGSTEWHILKLLSSHDPGWINRSDWTNVHMGSPEVAYINLIGAFIEGEVITEAVSGNTGIIQEDAGAVLTLKNVTGTGVFTNARQITGATSGATADVNGDTKNQDSNLFHQMGKNLYQLRTEIFFSTDGTENNSYNITNNILYDGVGGTAFGDQQNQIDIDNIKIQTGNAGIPYVNDAGAVLATDTEDWYYKVITYRII